MKRIKKTNKCCFIDYCSQFKEEKTSFHRFPTDPELCNSWCQSIKTFNHQKNAFRFHRGNSICGHHFRTSDKYIISNKTMLYKNVVPSIFPRRYKMECSHSESVEIETESFMFSSQDLSHDYNLTADSSKFLVSERDPFAEKNDLLEQNSCSIDGEDFFGFEADDLKNEIVNASTGEVYVVVTELENNVAHRSLANLEDADDDDVVFVENNEPENDAIPTNLSDFKETDDEIIFVENNVEVIEIDDDDDEEIPQTAQITKDKKLSRYDIQQMVIANHPQVQLRKPRLDMKTDQFRLVYINDETQILCTCTKCWELFDDINIDTVVRHARCNPTPMVSPCPKRKKAIEQEEHRAMQASNDTVETLVPNLTIYKIQTIAACMDVQTSSFYQGKRFLKFAQFLIDTGASDASTNKSKLKYESKYDVLCSFRNQLKDNQLSHIMCILNTPNNDFSLSCEIWEDSFRKKTNVSLDLHYLDTNFRRHRIVIGVRSINNIVVQDTQICDRILEILQVYSKKNNGVEFLQKAAAFVTSRKFDTRSLGVVVAYYPSACSIINDIADQIVNNGKLKIAEKCLHVIAWLNEVSTEKITVFDARKWQSIYELFKNFSNKKASFIHSAVETAFPRDYLILQLLEPFHHAIRELSEPKNNITKVFGIYKLLESHLTAPLECDKEMIKSVKTKALKNLRTAFGDSDIYQICMFLDPSNRDQYNALESDKMDSLQSKIDSMINPYMSTKENGCVENDLIHYMDDNVASHQNQIDIFLQSIIPSKDDPYEFWRANEQMPGLKSLARKYFTIPTYVSFTECIFSDDAKNFVAKRNSLETKDMETMLMMNSSTFDSDHTRLSSKLCPNFT